MRRLLLIITLLLAAVGAGAQDLLDIAGEDLDRAAARALRKVYHGKYHFVEEETGETRTMYVLNPIVIYPNERFRTKSEEEFYWKTVRDVKKTLPYAKLINRTIIETFEYIETFDSDREKEQYLHRFEGQVFNQYKPVMKKLTKSQGKMMIKLINRETNQSSYHIVKAFMGSFRAGFWQTFGHFYGVNLKSGYRPESNKEDALIERVCTRVEQGLL